jgi:hypothetical protein
VVVSIYSFADEGRFVHELISELFFECIRPICINIDFLGLFLDDKLFLCFLIRALVNQNQGVLISICRINLFLDIVELFRV